MNQTKRNTVPFLSSRIIQYLIVLAVISLTALLCRPLANQQGYHIVSFILLFIISIMAAFLGIGPILLASTLSALVWNYLFIPPHFTFHIEKTEDLLMFVSFFVIALLNGILTNRIRGQEKMVREREDQANTLFQLTRELSKASGIETVREVAMQDLKRSFDACSVFILQDGRNNLIFPDQPQVQDLLPGFDKEVVEWVHKNSTKAGRFTEKFSSSGLLFYPLTGRRLNPGVVGIRIDKPAYGKKDSFWDTYFTQISNAFEREFLAELAIKARILDESDKLYKTLFNLISHEFRIPIATIMGASDSLLMSEASEENREALYNEIFKASGRLNHLIENLLNMSRLESGKISLRRDWCDINDLINRVTRNLDRELSVYKLTTVVEQEMPPVRLDFGLMEQALYNLVLNSCQHSPSSSEILLEASYDGGDLLLQVSDSGPGFPEEALPRIFDKFYRVTDSKTGGLGLGLSIVRGIAEAHKGNVRVENLKAGGAKFTIRIPSEIPDMKSIIFEE